MKKILKFSPLAFIVLILIMVFVWSGGKIKVVFHEVPANDENVPYKSEILYPKNQNNQNKAGAGSGVAVNSKGHILYLHRAGFDYGNNEIITEPVILELDSETGVVLRAFGENIFKSPHGLSVDSEDNIWVTDVMLNKVFKLNPEGMLINTFGQDYPFYLETLFRIKNILPQFPATKNPLIFARPTDVVITNSGEFIVTDGYRNKRLAKFDSEGNLIWEVNKAGTEDGEFNLPHGLAIDSEGRLYVADRNNARIQVFSPDGLWLATWNQPELGRPFGLEVGSDGYLYIVDGGDTLNGKETNLHSQIIKMDLTGNILMRWGQWGNGLGDLMIPHDIAVDEFGNLYVAELNNKRLQKFMPIRK